MREKRVNVALLTCSVIVATCASLSYCFVTGDSHHRHLDKYVAIISRAIPLFLSGQISTASAATVWIPTDEVGEPEGSVKDEFAEVAHVFARPEAKVVKTKEEDEITHQAIPWTSLKNEWKIFQKIQSSQRKKPEDKLGKKKGNEQVADDDDEGSSEEDDGEDEDEEDEEGDEPAGKSGAKSPPPPLKTKAKRKGGSEERTGPAVLPPLSSQGPVAKAKKDNLPLAFYGQENHDDDEKDYLKDESQVFKKKKKSSNEEEAEEDDTSASNEVASIEDLDDYIVDDNEEDEEDEEKGETKKHDIGFQEIPLAIREMILNDLANQNNGTGYTPNLTPKVTGGHEGGSSGSVENDENSAEENSSEEEEDDKNASVAAKLADSEPTPPAKTASKKKKGDEEEDDINDDDHGGKGKGKGKGKKGKKGKKGGGGWGKPKGWGWQPQIHHHTDHGWGWDPEKHNGLLEQLVKGSTWERVLKYYHWKRDQSVHDEVGYDPHDYNIHGEHDHHDGHHHEHPGLELSGIHHGGWGSDYHQEGKIKKIVKGAFKGSFWERAFHTYAQYKEHQANNPKKPTLVDLDTDHLNLGR